MDPQYRLSPTMGSSTIAALAFIRQFVAAWGKSPSLSEIANALGKSRQTAKRAVRRLEVNGDIIRTPGQRGIALPEHTRRLSTADAIAQLRAAGFIVDEDILRVDPPRDRLVAPVTNPTLPLLSALEHIPNVAVGDRNVGNQSS